MYCIVLQGLVHRDVKPSNIYIDGDNVSLGDFGTLHTMGQVPTTAHTLYYISPEVRCCKACCHACWQIVTTYPQTLHAMMMLAAHDTAVFMPLMAISTTLLNTASFRVIDWYFAYTACLAETLFLFLN